MIFPIKTVSANWRRLAVAGSVVLIAAFLLFFRLGSLTHGLSAGEISMPASSWAAIWNNPLELPLQLLRFIPTGHSQFLLRLPSAILGAITLATFAYILRKWYGHRAVFYGLALFGISSWFLHVSRLATADSLYLLAVPALLGATLLIRHKNRQLLVFFVLPVIIGLLIYIPGLIWLIILSLWWHRTDLKECWQHFAKWQQRSAAAVSFIVTIALLIISIVRTPSLIRTWLGLPDHFASVGTIAENFGKVFLHIFIRGAHQPELWLGNLPVLSIFASLMFLVGVYFYARHWQAARSQQLLVLILLSAVLIALGGPVALSLIIPLIYLVAIAGIGYLLRQWLQVFPINPLVRRLGIGLVAIAVATVCVYNVRQYFIAWPHNKHTEAAFHNRFKD